MSKVETAKVREAAEYPEYDIQKLTKPAGVIPTREIIRMHATSKTTYDKYYMPTTLTSDGAPKPIRRTKQVKLPVSVDGKKFDDTESLWEYLTTEGGYSRAPKQVRRDKISR